MKILNAIQLKGADVYTINHLPISSINLMEIAANKITQQLLSDFPQQHSFHIFCGAGNNGGDGLAIARLLVEEGKKVFVYLLKSSHYRDDNATNLERLKGFVSLKLIHLGDENQIPLLGNDDLIIDAIMGSGLNKPLSGFIEQVVFKLNNFTAIKIAVDVPTGLFCNQKSDGLVFRADRTYTLHCPKLAFMMPENDKYIGEWKVLDIGLLNVEIENEPNSNFYLTEKIIKSLYKSRIKFGHKGTFGHGLLIAGSKGKMGAAVLSAKAAMRSGIGLLTTHVPSCGLDIMQIGLNESMVSVSKSTDYISDLPISFLDYSVIAIGPGLGKAVESSFVIKNLLQQYNKYIVLDADALNILSENKEWFSHLNDKIILTPHLGEFRRLVGEWKDDFEKIELQRTFSVKNNCVLVLKGAHTSVSLPNGDIYFNSTGNNGMATGGSGDVLTGIILGLLSCGYLSSDAAIFGVYLHGLAGDLAENTLSKEAMIASDIIQNLGNAFKVVKKFT